MKILIIFILAIFVFLLQITLLQFFKIRETKLDIILIFIVYTGLRFGSVYGMITGFMLGFIEDILSITVPGINVISKIFVGFLSGLFDLRRYIGNEKLSHVLTVFIFTLFDSFFVFILSRIFQPILNLAGFIFGNSFFMAIFLNSIFAPLIFFLFSKIYPFRDVA